MIKKFRIDVYERDLYICTGSKAKEMSRYFNPCIEPEEMIHSDAFVFKGFKKNNDQVGVYVMYFENDEAKTASTQAHESVHVADLIYEDLGIKHIVGGDEAYAYLVGFITGCVNSTRK